MSSIIVGRAPGIFSHFKQNPKSIDFLMFYLKQDIIVIYYGISYFSAVYSIFLLLF